MNETDEHPMRRAEAETPPVSPWTVPMKYRKQGEVRHLQMGDVGYVYDHAAWLCEESGTLFVKKNCELQTKGGPGSVRVTRMQSGLRLEFSRLVRLRFSPMTMTNSTREDSFPVVEVGRYFTAFSKRFFAVLGVALLLVVFLSSLDQELDAPASRVIVSCVDGQNRSVLRANVAELSMEEDYVKVTWGDGRSTTHNNIASCSIDRETK